MTEGAGNKGALSAERRELLERILEKKGISLNGAARIPKRPKDEPCPLSFGQQRLWFLDQLGGGTAYNMQLGLRLFGALDVTALHDALDALVERHEMLRTSFPLVEGRPVQVVLPHSRLPLRSIDLTESDEAQAQSDVKRIAHEDVQSRFSLEVGPLFRATVISEAAERHSLLLTMHHAVYDGWSMGIFTRELATLYESFVRGERVSLPELPIQYADFAHWQRGWLEGGAIADQLEYWREQLEELSPLELPTDHARPATQSFRGGHCSRVLPLSLTRALDELAQREGVTTFMMFLAGFQALLHRYTQQTDIVVGSPIANRNRSELEGIIGFFVNNLVLRTDLGGDPTVREMLQRVRQVAVGAYGHQDLPFEELVKALQPERDASRHPLFQIMLAVENDVASEVALPGLRLEPLRKEAIAARFDLEVEIQRRSDDTLCTILYSADLFDPDTVERMLGHFAELLSGMAADPEARISSLPLFDAEQEHTALFDWNASAASFPRESCVNDLVEAAAAVYPVAPAVVQQDVCLTYGELIDRADRLAARLQALGAGPEVRVGVYMERSVEMIVALVGILRAGAVYVPLDPDYPAQRLSFMLADAEVIIVLTQDHLRSSLPEYAGRVIALDSRSPHSPDDASLQSDSDSALDARAPVTSSAHPENLAYVIYTSGSTGQPKGVGVSHRALGNLVSWHVKRFGVTADDRLTLLAAPGFDASAWETWPCLVAGAALHVVDDECRTSPAMLRDWLVDNRITQTFLPTPLAEPALGLDWPSDAALRVLLTGGDRLHGAPPPGLPFELVNNYGPTENAVVATSGAVPAREGEGPNPSIGRPVSNAQVYLLDAQLCPVPIGAQGELFIAGESLARGYLGRPGLTAERFVPNPFGTSGSRLYRTGDLARHRSDGEIEFLGRRDDQVKLRGFRIELGEVEAALRDHPGVSDAVAVIRGDASQSARLVAYVVWKTEPALTSLRTFLAERLPVYMLPSATVALEELPISANGKLDRAALPAPDRSQIEGGTGFVAPRTPAEEFVASVWCEMLEIDRVSVHDNFFDLGGHSLLFTQVVAELEKEFGRKLELKELLFRSLEQIAAVCTASPDSMQPAVRLEPPERGRSSEPFLFGPEDHARFGCLHPPLGPARECAVVLCYPMGEEYVRFHRAFRQLADDLAVAGFPVLRFDFTGCGDSAGESESAELDLACWLQDVSDAIDETRRRTGAEKTCLVGFRLGATLALMTAACRDDVDAIALLDPVVRGTSYIDELREWHTKMLRYASVRPKAEPGEAQPVEEILGFGYGPRLIADLLRIDLEDLSELPSPPARAGTHELERIGALVVESRAQAYTAALETQLEARGATVEHRHIPHPELWERNDRFQIEDVNRVQMPRQLMRAALDWLAERYS